MTLIPANYVPVAGKEKAAALLRFVDELDELDDVQNVYSNFDIDASLLEELNK